MKSDWWNKTRLSQPWRSAVPSLLMLVLVFAWLLPGLVGHDPWKGDESRSIGFVHSLLSGAPDAIPTLAGTAMPLNPPLFSWVASGFAQALSGWLPVHDAARLAGGFFIFLTLVFVGLTGRLLYGSEHGRLAVLVLIGSVGLLVRAHEAIPQSALLAGFALAGYGLALGLRHPYIGGALAGTGIGVAFMSIGLVEALALLITALLLPVASPAWRTRTYLKSAALLVLAAAPWFIIWPLTLYQQAPAVLAEWWHGYALGRFAVFTPQGTLGTPYYLTFLPWFSWPAWPLALWAVWKARRHDLGAPGISLPLLMFVSFLTLLSFTSYPREVNALPLLLPLAWLAAGSTYTLRRGAANALYWFAMMTFLVIVAAAWVYWSAFDLGFPARLSAHVHKVQPGYAAAFRPFMVVIALAYTLGWLALLVLLKRSPQRPLIAWAAGITLAWGLAASLFMQPVNARMSYRAMIADLEPALPQQGCIASQEVSEAVRAMLDYYIDVRTVPSGEKNAGRCRTLLIQGDENRSPNLPQGQWHEIWQGHRPGNRSERFYLFQRDAVVAHANAAR
ncbi:MAG: glycosyltransferase family 39 protein [Pseudomonadota bacterium]